jgi:hypothetical protein
MKTEADGNGDEAGPAGPPPTAFRELMVLFTHEDEALASQALREVFPSAVFHVPRHSSERQGTTPPGIVQQASIEACPGHSVDGWFPDAPFEPRWEWRYGHWVLFPIPYPNMYMRRFGAGPVAGGTVDSLNRTDMIFRMVKDLPDQAREVARAIRRIKKFCSRKAELVRLPSLESLGPTPHMYCWAGPNAIAWAKESPRRVFLAGDGFAYRPLD